MRLKPVLAVAFFFWLPVLSFPANAQSERRPLWEVGVGAALLNLPHYPGADQRHGYALPLPYLIYRGEYLRADREGVRGVLLSQGNMQLNLSVNGTLPVSNKNNRARKGMKDLRPTLQLGPTLDISLWHSASRRSTVQLRFPLRASVTIESPPRHVGWLIEPTLSVVSRDVAGWTGWETGLSLGARFSDRRHNDYFYSVGPQHATPERPPYQAGSGYVGAHLTGVVSKRFSDYWVGAFLRYDTLRGAVIGDSPLVKQSQGVSAGLAFAWIIGRSSKQVYVADE